MSTDTDRVRELLGSSDPYDERSDRTDPAAREALLRDVLRAAPSGTTRLVPAARGPRRRGGRPLVVGAGVAACVAVCLAGALTAVVVLRPGGPTYLAPSPLPDLHPQAAGRPAGAELRRLARIAQGTPDRPASYRYAYSKAVGWYLSTSVEDGKSHSVTVPSTRETWVDPQGGGRSCETTGKPRKAGVTPSRVAIRTAASLTPSGCDRIPRHTFSPTDRELGRHPGDLARRLRGGDLPQTARILENVGDTLGQDAQTSGYTATVLRTLATASGLRYQGLVRDRLDRRAAAFTLRTSGSGLRTVDVLLVDPERGRITGAEEILLERGKLDLRVPAVISITTIVDEDYVMRVGGRPR